MRAAEQDRPDVAAARAAWAQAQAELAPERLVFIDETGTSTNMAATWPALRLVNGWSAKFCMAAL